ncbi:MAG TPA: hypothetical protein VFR67_23575, partial [Pilimelia sp.]|nr:hypothetical protein [Pilimelia sp.]
TSLEAVQHSVERIQNVNYSENGMSALQSDLEQLRTNLVALVTDVAAQFQAEIIEVRTAADQLAASVRTAAEDPSRANLDNARTALSGLDAAVDQLATAMAGTCSGAA